MGSDFENENKTRGLLLTVIGVLGMLAVVVFLCVRLWGSDGNSDESGITNAIAVTESAGLPSSAVKTTVSATYKEFADDIEEDIYYVLRTAEVRVHSIKRADTYDEIMVMRSRLGNQPRPSVERAYLDAELCSNVGNTLVYRVSAQVDGQKKTYELLVAPAIKTGMDGQPEVYAVSCVLEERQ